MDFTTGAELADLSWRPRNRCADKRIDSAEGACQGHFGPMASDVGRQVYPTLCAESFIVSQSDLSRDSALNYASQHFQ